MWFAGRRGRAAVADLAKVVVPLLGALRQRLVRRRVLRQLGRVGGQVEDDPVDPGAVRRVRVVADQREALRAGRSGAPVQVGRDVFAVGGVRLRYRAAFAEGGAAQLHGLI